jgi:hypothetical protein
LPLTCTSYRIEDFLLPIFEQKAQQQQQNIIFLMIDELLKLGTDNAKVLLSLLLQLNGPIVSPSTRGILLPIFSSLRESPVLDTVRGNPNQVCFSSFLLPLSLQLTAFLVRHLLDATSRLIFLALFLCCSL